MLFNINTNNKLEAIREQEYKLEKEIQKLTEDNLTTIFNFELIKSEFALHNFRIDSLAFDQENNSFVIIEYKRDKNFSVIDQGYAYLSLMLNNKADFILEYINKSNKAVRKENFDWSQTKVIFVAPSFTTYQKEAINFKDLPIELWEIKRYANNTVSFSQIQKANAKESIKTISRQDEVIEQVSKEIITYTEQEHLDKSSDEIKELYDNLKAAILNIGEFEIKPKKQYIAFTSGNNIVDIHLQQKAIKMWINMPKGKLDDNKNMTRDVFATGHWGNGDYELHIKNDEDFDYILGLIKQSYKFNKNK
jgi:predicted transport protein